MPTVLVMDGGLPKTLAVIRSLTRSGFRVLIAAVDGASAAAALSRHGAGLIRHPPADQERMFLDFLIGSLQQHHVDVLLPLDDPALLLLARNRRVIEGVTALAIPPDRALHAAIDKRETLRLVGQMTGKIGIPKTYAINDPRELLDLVIERFPVLVKPRTSSGAQGIIFVGKSDHLLRAYQQVHDHYPQPLIQEFVTYRPGEKYQLLYLFDHRGTIKMRYMHRIDAEMRGIESFGGPRLRGGNAAFWSSCDDPELLDCGQQLLESLGWQGFGFIECVRDACDGEFKLMEINARLSGTIALPLQQGVDFATGACLTAMHHEHPSFETVESGARARHSVMTLMGARQWQLLPRCFDPRFPDLNHVSCDPKPFLAAALRRLRPTRKVNVAGRLVEKCEAGSRPK
jgi:predicted ATP-grasp superfamily ATP-dependent carboligase